MSSVKVFIDLAFGLAEFIFGLAIEFARGNFVVGSQIDGVTQVVGWREFLWSSDGREWGIESKLQFLMCSANCVVSVSWGSM